MKKAKNTLLNILLKYLSINPMERLPAMLAIAAKLDKSGMHKSQLNTVRESILDEENVWHSFLKDLFAYVDVRCIQKLVECLVFNASFDGEPEARVAEERYGCNIPWAILMDPTSACNLKCTGCWAAQYGNRHNLSYETMDSIIRQGKQLGTHFYLFSGGEPLVQRDDIIKLCEEHRDCYFLSFTNGTLVDDKFCEDMRRVANLTLAFSIEGDEPSTDMRRGEGTYAKVVAAMERMRAHRLLFGYSTCYHRYNTESVGSDEFVDHMVSLGCRFAWNFTYIPVGKDARCDLLATPEQRAYMYRRVREIRVSKPIFALDFWNDGEFTQGCIAGGRRYLHINAAGDVEPCAFIHYSNVNIHNTTLLEALKSPLFMAYRENQPFNENHLRPCPLLDNPGVLASMVKESGALSTEMESPEDVDVLCAKTCKAAVLWKKTADELWASREDSQELEREDSEESA